MLGIRFKTLGL